MPAVFAGTCSVSCASSIARLQSDVCWPTISAQISAPDLGADGKVRAQQVLHKVVCYTPSTSHPCPLLAPSPPRSQLRRRREAPMGRCVCIARPAVVMGITRTVVEFINPLNGPSLECQTHSYPVHALCITSIAHPCTPCAHPVHNLLAPCSHPVPTLFTPCSHPARTLFTPTLFTPCPPESG